MSRLHACDALVLRTVDVGEADRFCILLTREHGRMAARARGAARPTSAFCSALLPLRRARVEFTETSAGYTLTSARIVEGDGPGAFSLPAFLCAQQGIDLLLAFTQDHQPLPEIFDATAQFLTLCASAHATVLLPYQLRLLHLLGLLPQSTDAAAFEALFPSDQSFVSACTSERDLAMLAARPRDGARIERFLLRLLEEHLPRPLKAKNVAEAMRA